MPRESRDVWTKRVERWRASGLTAEEYATETGVKANTLRHWSWLVGQKRRAREKAPAGRVAGRVPPAFVEVVTAPAAAVAATSAEPIEIVVRDAIRIRVPIGFDDDVLRRVIATVEAR
jgi:hypothetical protein